MKFLAVVVCLMLCETAFAQTDYAVLTNGDTLAGKIKYFNNSGGTASGKRYVQVTSDKGKVTFDIVKVAFFSSKNEIFRTVRTEQGYAFMKVIIPGYLTLFAAQLPNQTNWDGRYIMKTGGEGLEIPNIGFRKRVSEFLSNCPEVSEKVNLGELGKTDLVEIVQQFNACVQAKGNAAPITVAKNSSEILTLENTVKALPAFDKKADALEMIAEIKSKISRNEALPSFLISGLKDALQNQATVKAELDAFLATLK